MSPNLFGQAMASSKAPCMQGARLFMVTSGNRYLGVAVFLVFVFMRFFYMECECSNRFSTYYETYMRQPKKGMSRN